MENIMSHIASNIVIACVDFRFQNEFLAQCNKQLGNKTFDYLTYPGASKAILDRKSRDAIFFAISTLVKIHQTEMVVILDHIDCGAYGGSVRFSNIKDEINFHKEKLTEAGELLTKEFPEIKVGLLIYNYRQNKLLTV